MGRQEGLCAWRRGWHGNRLTLLARAAGCWMLQWPIVVLATLAAIIASQALISGAFSIVQQVSRSCSRSRPHWTCLPAVLSIERPALPGCRRCR